MATLEIRKIFINFRSAVASVAPVLVMNFWKTVMMEGHDFEYTVPP
jgi:hypothetical protein